MKPPRLVSLTAAVVVLSASAFSQALPTRRMLTLELAQAIAQETMAKCRADGYKISVRVVNADNVVKVILRDDGAFISSEPVTILKASTVILTGKDSGPPANLPAGAPVPPALPGTTNFTGGVAIKIGEEVIGAVGVSGAPGGDRDTVCAKAALTKLADRLK